ncbi:DUF1269 domain-containing protein [Verrucomicrobium sp. BvORR034]|uniref:DUF1269 domain-containing protein n=1 Tax=Verrucomicrobium sp. BvORR034 TaxID=1396418 RepID=UPI0009DD9D11|nr:DUF1269 domain-containing protein [Verrucomicrobium sp. BvORR034]
MSMKQPDNDQGLPETRLVVVAFDNVSEAFAMRGTLAGLRDRRTMDAVEMVVVVRDELGRVTLHQQDNLAVIGATYGSFAGLLASIVFLNPAGVLLGFGIGAISGRLSDVGISDAFMRELGSSFTNGTSALFALVRQSSNPDEVIAALQGFAGRCRVLQAPLPPENEARLRALLEKAEPGPAPGAA